MTRATKARVKGMLSVRCWETMLKNSRQSPGQFKNFIFELRGAAAQVPSRLCAVRLFKLRHSSERAARGLGL